MDYPKSKAQELGLDPDTLKFSDGNPDIGVLPSTDSAATYNSMIDELLNVIRASGQTPEENSSTQLADAIQILGSQVLSQAKEAVYPVGSIYTSTVATNPQTALGFGVWEAYAQGRALIGVGRGTDTRGEAKTFSGGQAGGEFNHATTVAEMPEHRHDLVDTGGSSSDSTAFDSGSDNASSASGHRVPTTTAGGGAPHNNIQPYIAIYVWNRTS